MNASKNMDGLMKACQQKRNDAILRAEKALDELMAKGGSISFPAVARRANVSVAWLYRQPAIRQRIDAMRGEYARQRACGDEPHQLKVESLNKTIKRLREENQALREQLEVVYGELYAQKDRR